MSGSHVLPYEFKDLWLISLPDLHSVFHGHDDVVSLVISTMFGTFLSSTYQKARNNFQNIQKYIVNSSVLHVVDFKPFFTSYDEHGKCLLRQ